MLTLVFYHFHVNMVIERFVLYEDADCGKMIRVSKMLEKIQ